MGNFFYLTINLCLFRIIFVLCLFPFSVMMIAETVLTLKVILIFEIHLQMFYKAYSRRCAVKYLINIL